MPEAVYQHRLLAGRSFLCLVGGRPLSSVDASISGVNFVTIPEITGWEVLKFLPRLPG